MNFKWIIIAVAFLCIQMTLTLASTKRKKSEEEAKENSINYYYNEMIQRPGSMFTSMLHDATLPVFLVMGAASVASILSSNGKNEGANGVHGRSKRSSPSAGWTSNILKVLGNVQKAIEKYQHLEDEIINDLDENVKREFESKSSD